MQECCPNHSGTMASIESIKQSQISVDNKLVAIVQGQQEIRERIATNEMAQDMMLERIEKLEPMTETLIRLSMGLETLIEKLDTHMDITAKHDGRLVALEHKQADETAEMMKTVKVVIVTAGITTCVGLLIPQVIKVLSGG